MPPLRTPVRTFLVVALLAAAHVQAQSAPEPEPEHDAANAGARGAAAIPLRSSPLLAPPRTEERGTVFLRAERIEGDGRQKVEATGGVELRSHFESVLADWVLYDTVSEEIWAKGNVRIRRGADTVSGPELLYRRNQATGYFTAPEFVVGARNGRGSAAEVQFTGPEQYFARDGLFTSCRAGDDSWFLKVGELELDSSRQVGTARNATLVFQSVPMMWTPFFDFSLSGERKSGFLTPSFGSSGTRGLEVRVPYYWNIAPNYDATVVPRFMSRRGLQLAGQFRYLFPSMLGEVNAEFLPNDRATNTNRNGLFWRHTQDLGRGFGAYLNLNRVSDDTYFSDLGDRVSVTSQTNLPREVGVTYSSRQFSALARLQRFQTLQDPSNPIVPPYERAPQLVANLNPYDIAGAGVQGFAQYDDFRHPTLVNGKRLVVHPTASYSIRRPAYFVTARAGLHLSAYSIDDPTVADERFNRAVPILSLDSGLAFERDWRIGGRDFLQTLEPRAFYVYVPFRSQNQIPSFDTALADLNFSQLFAENRYVGQDRIGDANQITLAVTTRLLDSATGEERLRFAIGERFYFQDQRVTLNEPPRTSSASDILVAAGGRLGSRWLGDVGLQFNPTGGDLERFNALIRYTPGPGRVVGAGYRYVRELIDASGNVSQINQIDLAAQWPLWGNWTGAARWNYSYFDNRLLEGIVALEYNADCWVLRLAAHRLATTTQTATNSFFVQLELGGFSRIGTNPLDLLRRNVPGYQKAGEGATSSVGESVFDPRF